MCHVDVPGVPRASTVINSNKSETSFTPNCNSTPPAVPSVRPTSRGPKAKPLGAFFGVFPLRKRRRDPVPNGDEPRNSKLKPCSPRPNSTTSEPSKTFETSQPSEKPVSLAASNAQPLPTQELRQFDANEENLVLDHLGGALYEWDYNGTLCRRLSLAPERNETSTKSILSWLQTR